MAVSVGLLAGGSRGVGGGLFVSCSHCWVEYKQGRLLASGSFCGANVITGEVAWLLPDR